MLKSLIQLFAERFLQNKYPDIAYQCGLSTTTQNQSISGGGQQNLIAPFCGWAVFQIGGNNAPSNQWFRLENSTRKTCYLSNASSSWKWASIPIQKATPSSLILVLTQALEILSSFVTNRLNNFASGGAAC